MQTLWGKEEESILASFVVPGAVTVEGTTSVGDAFSSNSQFWVNGQQWVNHENRIAAIETAEASETFLTLEGAFSTWSLLWTVTGIPDFGTSGAIVDEIGADVITVRSPTRTYKLSDGTFIQTVLGNFGEAFPSSRSVRGIYTVGKLGQSFVVLSKGVTLFTSPTTFPIATAAISFSGKYVVLTGGTTTNDMLQVWVGS